MNNTSQLDGLKLSDLEDPSQKQTNPDLMMNFRVLTYTISPGSVTGLQNIFNRLSRKDVRIVNSGCFEANGFAIGSGSFQEGALVAQELVRIGAVRTAQAHLVIPMDQKEPLSKTFLQGGEKITFAGADAKIATLTTPGPGFWGWVMSARPDPRFRGMAQVDLFPSFWQRGIEDIRLKMGMEPVDYQMVSESRALVRVEEQGVIVLGPNREMLEETTLDKALFFLPSLKPKIQFFVIICDSVEPR